MSTAPKTNEELIVEIKTAFYVTDEIQDYQSYPCHLTDFQMECVEEKALEAIEAKDTECQKKIEEAKTEGRKEVLDEMSHEQEKLLDGFSHDKDCAKCKAISNQ